MGKNHLLTFQTTVGITTKKDHIVILCSRLDLPGGIERAIANTANLLVANGDTVTLLVLDETAALFYPLSATVQVVQEHLHFGLTQQGTVVSRKRALYSHVRKLRSLLKALDPDLVLSTEYVFTIAAYLALGSNRRRLMAWEHHHFGHLSRSRFWQWLFNYVYPRLSCVVCLNTREAQLFEAIGCRTAVIPNFIAQDAKATLRSKTLLTIGWLTRLKGVDFIPGLAAEMIAAHPDAHWTIIGTGPEEDWLKAALAERNLASHVSVLAPVTHDIGQYYLNSALYVMLSRMECFPMVLLEAASHGVPAVAFDCPTGPAAIIEHGKNGLLIKENHPAGMAAAMIELLQNEKLRSELGENAYRSCERFSPAAVMALWERLFCDQRRELNRT